MFLWMNWWEQRFHSMVPKPALKLKILRTAALIPTLLIAFYYWHEEPSNFWFLMIRLVGVFVVVELVSSWLARVLEPCLRGYAKLEVRMSQPHWR